VAPLWPAGTVTLAGTESNVLLLAIDTTESAKAAASKVTEHLPALWLAIAEGEHEIDFGPFVLAPRTLRVKVWELPFRLAVNRAVWSEVTAATVAVNVALLNPEPILTLPGTVTLVLLLASVTLVTLEAAAVSAAVQVEVPGAFTVAGEQVKLLSWEVAVKLMVACWLWPLRVAVTMALWLVVTVPEVAVKVAVFRPDATVTLAGTVSKPLLLASETAVALVAALFNVTVQVLDALLPKVEGAHATDVSVAGATRLKVLVLVTLPALAVTIPVWLPLTSAPVAVKVLLVCPDATVTLEGTVRLVLLLESDTTNPLPEAAPLKVTEQEVLPGVLMLELVQLRLLKAVVTGREIVPEAPLEVIDVPPAVVATTLVSWIEIGLLEGFAAIWNVADATVPSAITVLLMPAARQLFPEQDSDFPALVVDAPATTVTPVMSEEKLKVHWSPAVWAPPLDASVMGTVTVPPAVPDPDPTDNTMLCPKAAVCNPSRIAVVRKILRVTFVYRTAAGKRAVGLSPRE
jgi:hypothetical protein